MTRLGAIVGGLALLFAMHAAPVLAQQGTGGGEWKYYAGDAGSTKYSPLSQINQSNVANLKVAWVCDSLNSILGATTPNGRPENTPLYVNGTLYTSSLNCLVAAVDPATGQTKWVVDPQKGSRTGRPANEGFVHRGMAYWTDGNQERLYIAAHCGLLCALDAKTGQFIEEFGEQGRVDFTKAIKGARAPSNYTCTSPPVICGNNIVIGSCINDGPQTKEMPRGDIQAFDVRTGAPTWVFHSVPQEGEFGVETWKDDAWKYTGNTNAWSCLTVDPELGYVYVPFGTPTNDWYGGHRLGDGLFAESIVCLDGNTGKRVWHFQTVHHGVWDYDLPSAPVLANIQVEGRDVKAVIQTTKSGFAFVFDRTNGKPVWPIEERPVAPSNVPGEQLSPTQPFPTKPAPFERQGSTEENLIDFTPELLAEAKEILNTFDHGPIFTPPSERGTIQLPGWGGGANWGGAGFDPETGIFYVPSVTFPITVKLNKPDGARSNFNYVRGAGRAPTGPHELPLFKPPYGRITAIDMNTGEHLWMAVHGDGLRKKISDHVGFDVGPVGSGGTGPLVTKSLVFFAQGMGLRNSKANAPANVLRAFDKATGKVVAEIPLTGAANGSPMTYEHAGKQYIVLATMDGKLIALALPSA